MKHHDISSDWTLAANYGSDDLDSYVRIASFTGKRQIELKLMHDAGMRREYEKAAKLLEALMNYKR
ncbi:hypothetical protein E2320_021008, partial [Naja naja]